MTRARLIEPVFRRRLTVLLAVGALWGCTMEEQGVQTPAVSPAGGGGAVTPADGAAASGGTSGSGEASGGASGNSGALASDAGTGSGGASASAGTSGGNAGSGSGGASANAGASGGYAGSGSGGASANGGNSGGGNAGSGSGGASANGGTSGGGNAGSGSGGASANGGTSGTDAAAGSGGTSASGGTSGTDAAAGSGGTSASGGTSRTDAAAGSGGTSASGGTSGRDAGSGSNDGTTSDGASGKDAGVDGPSWHLVWSDEFNLGANSGADTTKWNVATSEPYAVNGELQKYTTRPQNVFHDGQGHLVLRGLHDYWNSNGTIYPYTSGRLQSDGKFQFSFGRVEVRAKLPAGQGSFPAILLMGTTGNWPQCGEIGMMEQWGQDKSWLYCSTYSGASSDIKKQVTFPNATALSSDFHVYALEWYSDHMVFFIDGVQVARSNFDATSPFFTGAYYLILDVAVGGTMGGTIDAAGGFPMDMVLDYVRVYSQ